MEVEGIALAAPFAFFEDSGGNFFDRDVRIYPAVADEGATTNQQVVVADFFGKAVKRTFLQAHGSGIDKVLFGRKALLPVNFFIRFIAITQDFAHGFGQHVGVVFFGNDLLSVFVGNDQGRSQFIEFETAAALPINRFGNAALIFTVDLFFQAGKAMCVNMVAHFHPDPATSHFLCYGSGGAGT